MERKHFFFGGGGGSSILNAYFVLHCFVADSDASDDGEESSSASKFLQIVLENSFTNLVPRPFTPTSSIDHLQYAKTEGEGLGNLAT